MLSASLRNMFAITSAYYHIFSASLIEKARENRLRFFNFLISPFLPAGEPVKEKRGSLASPFFHFLFIQLFPILIKECQMLSSSFPLKEDISFIMPAFPAKNFYLFSRRQNAF